MGERDVQRGAITLPREIKVTWRNERKFKARSIARYSVLIALSCLFLLPFLWMIGTSLTPEDQILNRNRPVFPLHPAWENYRTALTNPDVPFRAFLINTLTIAVLCTIGQT